MACIYILFGWIFFQSIDLAYSNMKEGKILKAEGDLHNASINRSPAAYLKNPVEEQAR